MKARAALDCHPRSFTARATLPTRKKNSVDDAKDRISDRPVSTLPSWIFIFLENTVVFTVYFSYPETLFLSETQTQNSNFARARVCVRSRSCNLYLTLHFIIFFLLHTTLR